MSNENELESQASSIERTKEVQPYSHKPRSPQWNAARVNDRFLSPSASFAPKDKTTAAQVLFREGFTFEQVAEMFGYVKEGDRDD